MENIRLSVPLSVSEWGMFDYIQWGMFENINLILSSITVLIKLRYVSSFIGMYRKTQLHTIKNLVELVVMAKSHFVEYTSAEMK